jgi:hypothetical protein
MRYFGTLLAALTLAGCAADPAAPNDLLPDSANAPWQTDRSVYTLTYEPGMYSTRVQAQYTNKTNATVYLHRACGYGNEPSRYLMRADDREESVWLGSQVCISAEPRAPIPVGAGETYSQELTLYSSESPGANPPISMATRTGAFRIVFEVQSTDRVGGWTAVDLLPESERVSNVFTVLAPQ